MSGGILTFILIAFISIFYTPESHAQIINEICPVSSGGHDYEWVEIYNNTDNTISTEQLSITDSTNKSLTWQAGEIPPGGYILATSSSVLNNSGGDNVVLKDNTGKMISSQNYAESFSANYSYIRCDDGHSWLSSSSPSPLSDNGSSCHLPAPTTGQSDTESDYTSVFISEIMVDPAPDQNEWVEIYNNNSFSVNLNNWQIDDVKDQGATPYTFSINVAPYSYVAVDIAKSIFNNDGDTIRLLNNQSAEKESFIYISSEKEKSIGKIDVLGSAVCIQNPSKNSINLPCINIGAKASVTQPNLQAITNSEVSQKIQITSNTNDPIASQEQNLASQESSFSLPNLIGSIKGITTAKKHIIKNHPQPDPEELKTASSYAMTSFMFAWANICYILFKIRRKMKLTYENTIA